MQLMDQTEDGRAPEFTWGLMSLKVMDGEEVKFRCEVSLQQGQRLNILVFIAMLTNIYVVFFYSLYKIVVHYKKE